MFRGASARTYDYESYDCKKVCVCVCSAQCMSVLVCTRVSCVCVCMCAQCVGVYACEQCVCVCNECESGTHTRISSAPGRVTGETPHTENISVSLFPFSNIPVSLYQ